MLAQTRLRVGPEHLVRLVPRMLPESGCLVIGALVRLRDLIHSVIIVLRHILWIEPRCSEHIERQSHEDTVEPHLPSIDGLMPPHTLIRPRLVFQLSHQQVKGQ